MVNMNIIADEFERNRKIVMELPDIDYEVSDEFGRRVTILEVDVVDACPHKHVSMVGNMYFFAGDVWDDIEEVCEDCGKVLTAGGE